MPLNMDPTTITKEQVAKLQAQLMKNKLNLAQEDHWYLEIQRIKAERAMELEAEERIETDPRLHNAGFLVKKICFRSKLPERYILSYKTPFKQYWDLIILLLAVYNSIMIPVEQCYKPKFLQSAGFSALNLLIDFIFLVDIILMFFTSVINFRGRESYDS